MRAIWLLIITAAAVGLALPAAAAPQILEVWETAPNDAYVFVFDAGDLNNDGVRDLVTLGDGGHGLQRVEVRSALTGEVQASSTYGYDVSNPVLIDLDGDGHTEILFSDGLSELLCLEFNGAPGPLRVRWAIDAFPGVSYPYFFADLDGTGQLYVVAYGAGSHGDEYKAYTSLGTYFAQYMAGDAYGMSLTGIGVDDYDGDNRQEIMLLYHDGAQFRDHMILLESNATAAAESGAGALRAMELGASIPNPALGSARIGYTVPTQGPVSLRVFDVAGREVRTLIRGTVAAGRHETTWDGRDAEGRQVPAGAYFYELNAGGKKVGRQVIRLK